MTAIMVLACLVFLGSGYLYWKDKTSVAAGDRTTVADSGELDEGESTTGDDEDKQDDEKMKQALTLAAHWPEKARDELSDKIQSGDTYKIALVGSLALGGDDGWAAMLQDEMLTAYGEDILDIESFAYDETSTQFIAGDGFDEVVAYKPDLVLYEPFLLNDNWYGSVLDNQANIETFIAAVEDAVVILQPARPVYNGTYYPRQVADLKEFAEKEGIPYLDHWEVWPDYTSEELNDYVVDGESSPSTKGHEIWLDYLKEYFIASEE